MVVYLTVFFPVHSLFFHDIFAISLPSPLLDTHTQKEREKTYTSFCSKSEPLVNV